MKAEQIKSPSFALIAEMLETPGIIRALDAKKLASYGQKENPSGRVLLTGEGSSRIFPAGRAVAAAWRAGVKEKPHTESAIMAMEFDLEGALVFMASNSGKTAEGIRFIRSLDERYGARGSAKRPHVVSVVANPGTPIADEADECYILSCGKEKAIAATKSVVEQAVFYDILFRARWGLKPLDLGRLAEEMDKSLKAPVDPAHIDAIAKADAIFWVGRNDGPASELTLKTNEIVRKRADFLEGTYALHGIEEIMNPGDAVILVDPYPHELEKFRKNLQEGVGCKLIAIGGGTEMFPGIALPDHGELNPYTRLAAGWNLLVEAGLTLGVDLDKPKRARKVGNEFTG